MGGQVGGQVEETGGGGTGGEIGGGTGEVGTGEGGQVR